ncbi:MAG: helix-turn-helix transcriptional regulator [Eubacteriales bacterium]
MLTEKAIAICLLEIMKEYSSESHILSMGDIRKKMNAIYGLNPDRRTIYGAFDTLTELGYDISLYKDNGKGYYLIDRLLEPSEAHLLSDAICTFPFISERQTSELMKKIQFLVSVHDRKQIKNLTVMKPEQKTINKNVFYNIEMLDEAINRKVKVKFDYYDYGADKQLHKRREKKYTVNPYGMVYSNEHYYLICIMAKQEHLSMYRIDRIQNIEITDYQLDEREANFEPKSAVKTSVYAYTGEIATVEMLLDLSMLNDVIDKFGTKILITEQSDGRLKVSVKASLRGMKYWALQYMEYVEIISPQSLRDDIEKAIQVNCYSKA